VTLADRADPRLGGIGSRWLTDAVQPVLGFVIVSNPSSGTTTCPLGSLFVGLFGILVNPVLVPLQVVQPRRVEYPARCG
jgi:hypothetical protein